MEAGKLKCLLDATLLRNINEEMTMVCSAEPALDQEGTVEISRHEWGHGSDELSFNDSDASASVLSSLDDLDPLDADMAAEVAHDVSTGDKASLGDLPGERTQPEGVQKAASSVLPHLAALAAVPDLATGASLDLAESDLSMYDVEDVQEMVPDLDMPIVTVPVQDRSMLVESAFSERTPSRTAAAPQPSAFSEVGPSETGAAAAKPEHVPSHGPQKTVSDAPTSPCPQSPQQSDDGAEPSLLGSTNLQQLDNAHASLSGTDSGTASSHDAAEQQLEDRKMPIAETAESQQSPADDALTTSRRSAALAEEGARTGVSAGSAAAPAAAPEAASVAALQAAAEVLAGSGMSGASSVPEEDISLRSGAFEKSFAGEDAGSPRSVASKESSSGDALAQAEALERDLVTGEVSLPPVIQ